MANKQIPALPPLDEAPADDDRLAIRDTSSGSDKSLRVDRMLERSADQVSEHAKEQGGIHGIPEGERALHTGDDSDALSDIPEGERALNSEELLAAVSEAADIDEAVSFVGKGAIVESDTNANGSYVRWENGEQVCWAMNVEIDTSTVQHNPDYPASWLETPFAWGTPREGTVDRSPADEAARQHVRGLPSNWRIHCGVDIGVIGFDLFAWGFWK